MWAAQWVVVVVVVVVGCRMIGDVGRNGAAVLIRDQWVGNFEYPETMAMESWARVLRKRVA